MIFLWESFAPHHDDRCEACASHFSARYDVYGLEIATYDANYRWYVGKDNGKFRKLTLFPGEVRQEIGTLRCATRIVTSALRMGSRYVFLCNYESPAIFLSAIILRLLRRRVIIMQDSKFDDKQRHLPMEILKSILYRPYHAALAAGPRTKSYLRFLRFPENRVFVGYDTVSVDRLQRHAGSAPAPAGIPHANRHFTVVARLVPKKNLTLALDAYAEYLAAKEQESAPSPPRALHICGSGELEPALREQARQLGLEQVHFHGYMNQQEVARILASTLTLILPSVEEQHGLVINEALAMGVPVLVSDNCGARDLLVRSGVNGYVFEADNISGLAHFMNLLDRDATEWARLSQGTHRFLPVADTSFFVASVERALAYFSD
jgi:glycosyltransferase involved in cell wall biosynthesis